MLSNLSYIFMFTGNEPAAPLTNAMREELRPIESQLMLPAVFSAEDLHFLLADPNVMGLRFYPATKDEEDRLLATGVNSARSDIHNRYIRNADNRVGPSGDLFAALEIEATSSIQLDQLTKREAFANANATGFCSVYFSRKSLNEILTETCRGVRIVAVIHDSPHLFKAFTLVAIPLDAAGDEIMINEEVAALRSLAPCPPDCGTPDQYLNPYNINLNISKDPLPAF